MPHYKLVHGDAVEVLRRMPDNSVGAIISDAPYGLSDKRYDVRLTLTAWLLGKDVDYSKRKGLDGLRWDGGVPQVSFWIEAFRVMKPGGYVACFSAGRTNHLVKVCADMVGFHIHNDQMWVHSGSLSRWKCEGVAVQERVCGVRGEEVAQGPANKRLRGTSRKPTIPEGHRYEDHRGGTLRLMYADYVG